MNIFNFKLMYLFVNTYTGDVKWLPLEEGLALQSKDSYWEQDTCQPTKLYDESFIE